MVMKEGQNRGVGRPSAGGDLCQNQGASQMSFGGTGFQTVSKWGGAMRLLLCLGTIPTKTQTLSNSNGGSYVVLCLCTVSVTDDLTV